MATDGVKATIRIPLQDLPLENLEEVVGEAEEKA